MSGISLFGWFPRIVRAESKGKQGSPNKNKTQNPSDHILPCRVEGSPESVLGNRIFWSRIVLAAVLGSSLGSLVSKQHEKQHAICLVTVFGIWTYLACLLCVCFSQISKSPKLCMIKSKIVIAKHASRPH